MTYYERLQLRIGSCIWLRLMEPLVLRWTSRCLGFLFSSLGERRHLILQTELITALLSPRDFHSW